jgi:hypothetical protein
MTARLRRLAYWPLLRGLEYGKWRTCRPHGGRLLAAQPKFVSRNSVWLFPELVRRVQDVSCVIVATEAESCFSLARDARRSRHRATEQDGPRRGRWLSVCPVNTRPARTELAHRVTLPRRPRSPRWRPLRHRACRQPTRIEEAPSVADRVIAVRHFTEPPRDWVTGNKPPCGETAGYFRWEPSRQGNIGLRQERRVLNGIKRLFRKVKTAKRQSHRYHTPPGMLFRSNIYGSPALKL